MEPGTLFLIITIGIILVLFSLLRRRGGPKKYPEVVQSILWDIKLNQAMAERFLTSEKVRYFEQNGWLLNKTRIGFLSESLKDLLKDTFTLTEEINRKIRESKKNKTQEYRNIDLTQFKELLVKCREGLEDWMVTNTGSKEYQPKQPGMSSFFLGDN